MATEKKESGFDLALSLAREQLGRLTDLPGQCEKSGASYVSPQKVVLDYLGRKYEISLPGDEVEPASVASPLSLRERILVLHYFLKASGKPLSGRLVAYQELPDGAGYLPVFRKRAVKPLLDHFGTNPTLMVDLAASLGAKPADFGDAAFTVAAFPRVPVTVVLWKGDEEFPPDGKYMFDSTIPEYLTTDDTNVLCETIAWWLVRMKTAPPSTPR